jgi:hypothetical protein
MVYLHLLQHSAQLQVVLSLLLYVPCILLYIFCIFIRLTYCLTLFPYSFLFKLFFNHLYRLLLVAFLEPLIKQLIRISGSIHHFCNTSFNFISIVLAIPLQYLHLLSYLQFLLFYHVEDLV